MPEHCAAICRSALRSRGGGMLARLRELLSGVAPEPERVYGSVGFRRLLGKLLPQLEASLLSFLQQATMGGEEGTTTAQKPADDGKAEAALRAELEAMKPSARKKRALAAGATEEEADEAGDADDAVEASVALIMAHEQQLTEPPVAKSTDDDDGRDSSEADDDDDDDL